MTHGNTKHGMYLHPVYNAWNDMRQRCNNPKSKGYKNYGGRGIKVCKLWDDIGSFIHWSLSNGWKPGLQIDRKNNDGNYEPENCHFVTNFENNLNTQLLRSTNTTGYRGVSPHRNVYAAGVKVNYRRIYLGTYVTPKEAARVRDDYVIKHNLGLPLNFGENS